MSQKCFVDDQIHQLQMTKSSSHQNITHLLDIPSQVWIYVRQWTTAVNICVSTPIIPTSADVLKVLF